MEKKKLVVLTGAGISAESGIATFRGADGLWEGHRIEEVASPEGWMANPLMVLEFYNQRRRNVVASHPNNAHKTLKALEEFFDVVVVTQNVDDLHERAGSSNIMHLHGEIRKARSTRHAHLVYNIEGSELNMGDLCERGAQLRPHIVWFGEAVPMIDFAVDEVRKADVFLVVGTSLQVYPAAGLLHYAPPDTPTYVVDPNMPRIAKRPNLHLYEMGGSEGMARVYAELTGKVYQPE